MITFLTAIHISTVVLLVITVLLQSGKGAEISASFGGSSQTVFGSSGGANFFQKLTYTLAAIFMITSLTLTILPNKVKHSVFEGYTPPANPVVPNPVIPTRVPPAGQVPDPSAPGGVPADAAAPAAGNGAPGPANKTNPVSGATENTTPPAKH